MEVVLTGNEKNISWEEEGKEFSFNGLMYDVVRTRIANNKTILLCVNDEMEDKFVEGLNDITKSNQQQDSRHHAIPVFTLLVCDVFCAQPIHFLSLGSTPVPARRNYAAALSNRPGTINLPPPRHFV